MPKYDFEQITTGELLFHLETALTTLTDTKQFGDALQHRLDLGYVDKVEGEKVIAELNHDMSLMHGLKAEMFREYEKRWNRRFGGVPCKTSMYHKLEKFYKQFPSLAKSVETLNNESDLKRVQEVNAVKNSIPKINVVKKRPIR